MQGAGRKTQGYNFGFRIANFEFKYTDIELVKLAKSLVPLSVFGGFADACEDS